MVDGNILAPFQPQNHDHRKCIDDAIAAAETRCARDGRSFTALRRQVLELVWSSHGPVGAYDLLDMLRAKRRNAAPPTVYRALEFLLQCGLIHRIESLNAYVGCGSPYEHHGGQSDFDEFGQISCAMHSGSESVRLYIVAHSSDHRL